MKMLFQLSLNLDHTKVHRQHDEYITTYMIFAMYHFRHMLIHFFGHHVEVHCARTFVYKSAYLIFF